MFWEEEDEVKETKFSKFKWNRCLACRRNQPNFRETPSVMWFDALGHSHWFRAHRLQGPDGQGTSHPQSGLNVEHDVPTICLILLTVKTPFARTVAETEPSGAPGVDVVADVGTLGRPIFTPRTYGTTLAQLPNVSSIMVDPLRLALVPHAMDREDRFTPH